MGVHATLSQYWALYPTPLPAPPLLPLHPSNATRDIAWVPRWRRKENNSWTIMIIIIIIIIIIIKINNNNNKYSLHFTYPIVYLTVGAPRMIGQPLFSILLCFRPFEGLHPTLILSTPLCCLPISFSVCLSFSLLVQCPVGSSLQVLLILFCAHTISVFVSSQWWEDLHRAQWLVWFCSPLSHL